VRDAVDACRKQFGDSVPSEVVAAWLATQPEAAEKHVLLAARSGNDAVLLALRCFPERGRAVLTQLAGPGAPAAKHGLTAAQGNRALELLREWGSAQPGDAPLLRLLAELEPRVAYRAEGYLLRLQPDDEAALGELDSAIRSARGNELTAAIEGARIAGDARLAAALVGLAAQAKLGPERIAPAPGAAAAGKPGADAGGQAGRPADGASANAPAPPNSPGGPSESPSVVLAAYALTYMPGDQAELVRTKLLGAVEPLLRWQARLGELLHGNPRPWQQALREQGADGRALWLALEPQEARDPALLDTYKLAAVSAGPDVRGRAARQLNRYGEQQSERTVGRLLARLVRDEVPAVCEAAWYTLGELALRPAGVDPQAAVVDTRLLPEVRLAAADCALRLAAAGR
jgi:hypothetical protein